MKKFSSILAVALLFGAVVFNNSCTSYKNVPYIQNSMDVDLTATRNTLYDARIMPKDILTITVNCPEDEKAAQRFNLTTQIDRNSSFGSISSSGQLQQYIVSNDGKINFPLVGEITVVGKTKTELERSLESLICPRFITAQTVVVVNMANYKVAVLGEVNRSGMFTATNGKMNIFEALAQAGDMTIWGRRDSVKVIRENEFGERSIAVLNLNDANVIASPYYQLQQNDIVIVTPNKTKAKNSGIGSETSLWFSATSILVSLASLLYNILK